MSRKSGNRFSKKDMRQRMNARRIMDQASGRALYSLGSDWSSIAIGTLLGLILSIVAALAIALFSLRVQSIFFAMITLAVASAFAILCSQLGWLTGGEDGRTFRVPEILRPGTRLLEREIF